MKNYKLLLLSVILMAAVSCAKDQPETPETPVTDLSASGTANCYIVSAAGDYKFKATVKGNSTEDLGYPSSAEVLWESFGTTTIPSKGDVVNNSVSVKGEYVYFSTPKSLNNGNAVIAVRDKYENIIWSWHIWVCDGYDSKASAQVYNNNAGKMMDRNLGATSAKKGEAGSCGLLYQWGRKDPFIGASDYYNDAASTLSWPKGEYSDPIYGSIAYAIAHPTTFIKCNSDNSDWYWTGSSTTDDTRWKSSKTMYDPCPQGWRVPDGGENGVWSKAFGSSSYYENGPWDDINKGMDFGSGNGKSSSMQLGSASTIWYPAAGYRSEIGSFENSNCYCWSCTPKDLKVYAFDFYPQGGHVNPSLDYYRANGFSVRCISE